MKEISKNGFVSYEKVGDVGVVTLQRPPQNRLTRQVFSDIGSSVRKLARAGIRALLIRGDGPDFCLGGDFREWRTLTSHLERRERFGFSNGVLNMIESLAIPTITAVHGRAFGGGLELALHTDFIIAGSSATFRFPEVTLGVAPLAGGVQRVAERAGRSVAARLVMFGEEISAQEASRLNIATHVVADGQVDDTALELANRLARGPTRAHAVTKMILSTWSAGGVRAADEVMIEQVSGLVATEDVVRGVESAAKALESGAERPELMFSGN
ncbi:enoyl-CoA hydratase/isomerase family protein [Paraburkholderia sediminicola]|uniref:enoyl-CoA hydratase/isomerase family protein n=1 Tax=Paraburkholderia sediminicola TaxID=458836 RepID=UPI0038BD1287